MANPGKSEIWLAFLNTVRTERYQTVLALSGATKVLGSAA